MKWHLTRMAVLSGSVEMGWLQAVSLNLSPPVYARICGLKKFRYLLKENGRQAADRSGKIRLQCAAGPNVASTLYCSRLLRPVHTLHLFQVSSARVDSFVGNTQVGGSPREWAPIYYSGGANGKLCSVALLPGLG